MTERPAIQRQMDTLSAQITEWRRMEAQEAEWADAAEAKGDGANRHAHAKAQRVYRECADSAERLCALSAPDAGLVSERDEARARAERAEGRLREISDLLEDAGVPGGTTLYGGVMMLRERAERAEVDAGLVEAVREYRNALASYTDGRNDLVECDERTRKAHDALLAFPLPTPGGHPGAAARAGGER